MSQVRKCYNENCENNYMGAYCECCEITIGENGCCYNYFPRQEKENEENKKGGEELMDREKQIEEMAKITCSMYCRNKEKKCANVQECDMKCSHHQRCEALYNAGYRKQNMGEWIMVGEGITERVVCSNCNSEKGSFMKPPFCNQCGAIMKGGSE